MGARKASAPAVAGAVAHALPEPAQNRLRQAGITLADLAVTLAFVGVVLAIATPPLAKLYKRNATRLAAGEFVTTHRLARSMALEYGRVAELHIDAAGDRFWVEVDTGYAGGVSDTIGQVRNIGEFGVGITSNRSLLCFDSRGLPTVRSYCDEADALVVFTREDKSDTVKISAFGKLLR